MSVAESNSKYRVAQIHCGPEYGPPADRGSILVLYESESLKDCLAQYEHHRELSGTGTEIILVLDGAGSPLYACS